VAKSSERPHVLDDYFEKTQWANPETEPFADIPNIFEQMTDINIQQFTLQELRQVLNKANNNKSTGSDCQPHLFFQMAH
jgi:hypothetical protein